MTDPAIIAASYAAERNYSHNPDDVIDSSDAALAIGTEKTDTTTLKDSSLTGNDATIHGPMPTEGFIQGRRFDGVDNYLDCGNDASLNITDAITIKALVKDNLWKLQSNIADRVFGIKSNYSMDIRYGIINLWIPDGVNWRGTTSGSVKTDIGKYNHILATWDGTTTYIYKNGIQVGTKNYSGEININSSQNLYIGGSVNQTVIFNGSIVHTQISNNFECEEEAKQDFNTIARLPFWSINYTDYPDNVAEYTDNLPYSSSIISSGTFKVDDDKLQCVSAGTMTYSASYEFDGSEYIKVEIDGVEYADTGTITQGNTTVSVAQGSNKITIIMGTADTIDKVRIQFRKEV